MSLKDSPSSLLFSSAPHNVYSYSAFQQFNHNKAGYRKGGSIKTTATGYIVLHSLSQSHTDHCRSCSEFCLLVLTFFCGSLSSFLSSFFLHNVLLTSIVEFARCHRQHCCCQFKHFSQLDTTTVFLSHLLICSHQHSNCASTHHYCSQNFCSTTSSSKCDEQPPTSARQTYQNQRSKGN